MQIYRHRKCHLMQVSQVLVLRTFTKEALQVNYRYIVVIDFQ